MRAGPEPRGYDAKDGNRLDADGLKVRKEGGQASGGREVNPVRREISGVGTLCARARENKEMPFCQVVNHTSSTLFGAIYKTSLIKMNISLTDPS